MQGLSDALADVGEGTDETPVEEYAMMLEVMMADCPGRPHPSTFSWNAGMVMHVLKSDPVLRELEHVQVDGPGTAYLFFYNKQGHRGLQKDTALRGQAENPVHNIPVMNAGESDSSDQLV